MPRFLLLAVAVALVAPTTAAAAQRPLGRIVIPRLSLDTAFYNGQRAVDTARGPSRYPWTGMPGQRRTVAIAGHRVSHTRPFRHLERLRLNDVVRIEYGPRPKFPRRACYRVTGRTVVGPRDVHVLRERGFDRLVLTTCTPPGSTKYRLVVFARPAKTCA